jgi:hypothetical protein
MAKCSKCGSPVCKCGPLHYSDSPVKQVGVVDPNTGMPIAPAQQMTNVPPQQANTLGTAQPVFKPQAQQAAQGIYGGIEQRQNAVGATPIFQKNQFGNTKEEQAKLNSANKIKQEKFPNEYNNYKKAVYDKKNWEETENDFGFGGKEYPGQRTLDSLRTVYRNKK